MYVMPPSPGPYFWYLILGVCVLPPWAGLRVCLSRLSVGLRVCLSWAGLRVCLSPCLPLFSQYPSPCLWAYVINVINVINV